MRHLCHDIDIFASIEMQHTHVMSRSVIYIERSGRLLRRGSDNLRPRYAAALVDQLRPLDAFARLHPIMAIKNEDEEYHPLLANWDREVYNEYQRRTIIGDVVPEARGMLSQPACYALANGQQGTMSIVCSQAASMGPLMQYGRHSRMHLP